MATTAANLETPSKKVAAELAKVDMNKSIDAKKVNGDAGKKAIAEADAAADDEAEHGKFVGEVDLPEEEEPLLVESNRRFVLFPIRYHEVCRGCNLHFLPSTCSHPRSDDSFSSLADLANVQESRGVLLDSGRD